MLIFYLFFYKQISINTKYDGLSVTKKKWFVDDILIFSNVNKKLVIFYEPTCREAKWEFHFRWINDAMD
jgi:hypothetical protein